MSDSESCNPLPSLFGLDQVLRFCLSCFWEHILGKMGARVFGTDFLLKNTSPGRRKFYHIIDFFMQFYSCLPKQAKRGRDDGGQPIKKALCLQPNFQIL